MKGDIQFLLILALFIDETLESCGVLFKRIYMYVFNACNFITLII